MGAEAAAPAVTAVGDLRPMSEPELIEVERQALVEAARKRLRQHLDEEAAALAGDDPALAAVTHLGEQLRGEER